MTQYTTTITAGLRDNTLSCSFKSASLSGPEKNGAIVRNDNTFVVTGNAKSATLTKS